MGSVVRLVMVRVIVVDGKCVSWKKKNEVRGFECCSCLYVLIIFFVCSDCFLYYYFQLLLFLLLLLYQ